MAQQPPESFTFSPEHAKFRLSLSNLITLVGIVAGAAVAWQKIPNSDDVQHITTESIRQAMEAAKTVNAQQDQVDHERMGKLEAQSAAANAELMKMNQRMDYLLILLAGSSADNLQRSTTARSAAERVRRNLKAGADPLEGLPLSQP